MAMRIVNILEAIHIKQDERQRVLMTCRAHKLAVQRFLEVTMVVQVGQSIPEGKAPKFLIDGLQLTRHPFGLSVQAGILDRAAHLMSDDRQERPLTITVKVRPAMLHIDYTD